MKDGLEFPYKLRHICSILSIYQKSYKVFSSCLLSALFFGGQLRPAKLAFHYLSTPVSKHCRSQLLDYIVLFTSSTHASFPTLARHVDSFLYHLPHILKKYCSLNVAYSSDQLKFLAKLNKCHTALRKCVSEHDLQHITTRTTLSRQSSAPWHINQIFCSCQLACAHLCVFCSAVFAQKKLLVCT